MLKEEHKDDIKTLKSEHHVEVKQLKAQIKDHAKIKDPRAQQALKVSEVLVVAKEKQTDDLEQVVAALREQARTLAANPSAEKMLFKDLQEPYCARCVEVKDLEGRKDANRKIANEYRLRAVIAKSEADSLREQAIVCPSAIAVAARKVKEVTLGMTLENMGACGVALHELRAALEAADSTTETDSKLMITSRSLWPSN